MQKRSRGSGLAARIRHNRDSKCIKNLFPQPQSKYKKSFELRTMLVLEVVCFTNPSMMEMVSNSNKKKGNKLKQLKERQQEIRIKMKCDREDFRERKKPQ